MTKNYNTIKLNIAYKSLIDRLYLNFCHFKFSALRLSPDL